VLRNALTTLLRHSAVYAVAKQLSRLAGFLLLPLTTGFLSPAEFGLREILAVSLSLLAQIAGLHLGAAVSRFYFERADPVERRNVISTAVLAVGLLAALIALLLGASSTYLARLLPGTDAESVTYVRLTVGIFAFQTLRELTNKVLQTEQRSGLFAGLSLCKLLVELTGQIVALAVLGMGLAGVLWAILLSEALFAGLGVAIVLARAGLSFRASVFLPMLAYSLPLIPNGVLQFGLHSSDRYLVGALAGDDALGLYALGYKLGYIPNYLVLGPFLLIWYPFVFSLGERSLQRETIGRLAHLVLSALGAVCLGVALFARELTVASTGQPDYFAAQAAIPWVALGYWLWGLFQFLQTGFYVEKQTARLPLLTLAALLVNVYVNGVLIPILGFLGAAVSTAITFGVLCAATLPSAERIFPVHYRWNRILGPMALAVLIWLAAHAIPQDWSPWAQGSAKLVALASWGSACWWGLTFNGAERASALRELRRWLRRSPTRMGPAR
jgi:O-antigen/teichoic acid export membrane protein